MKIFNLDVKLLLLSGVFITSACGGGGGGGGGGSEETIPPTDPSYTVGGTVNGLDGSGLELQFNGTDNLSINSDGSYNFPAQLKNGDDYIVEIIGQPSNATQACSISNDKGIISGADITNVNVQCITSTFIVGGLVTGLQGTGLVLQNNNTDDYTVDGASFEFSTEIASGQNYSVTVLNQPTSPSQTCTVTNGMGSVTNEHISNINIDCVLNAGQRTIGGVVNVGGGIVKLEPEIKLQNNGNDDLPINSPGNFQFAPLYADGDNYTITILSQPSTLTCTVSNGTGTISGLDITDVVVDCIPAGALVGQFVSSGPVEGLIYDTGSFSGRTNTNGEFFYQDNETVSFKAGGVTIGQQTVSAVITPFTLNGITNPPTTALDIRSEVNLANSQKQHTPLEVVSNTVLLLQTLDEDADPSNGIKLPDQLEERGSSVNVLQKRNDFFVNFAFRKLISDVAGLGAWGGDRAIKTHAYAMDALYDGLNITFEASATSSLDVDRNADGVINSSQTYSYDVYGNRDRIETDSNSDGNLNDIEIRVYDENGNETLFEDDGNADGAPELRKTSTYTARGERLSEVTEYLDGTGDTYTESYVYDNYNRPIRKEQDNRPADGSPNQIQTWLYNGETLTQFTRDFDGDNVADYVETYSYDPQNLLTQIVKQFSTRTSVSTFTYDAMGNVISEAVDDDNDGADDWIETFDYNTNGYLIANAVDYTDPTRTDHLTSYQYDARGNRTRIDLDSDNDGTLDLIRLFDFDSIGNQITSSTDQDADGIVDSAEIWAHDANGTLLTQEIQRNSNGIANELREYTAELVNRWSATSW